MGEVKTLKQESGFKVKVGRAEDLGLSGNVTMTLTQS